jgi:hypothetical protein
MYQGTTKPEAAAAKRLQLRRRVKRGVVAGYIHEISARHQHVAAQPAERREQLVTSSRTA